MSSQPGPPPKRRSSSTSASSSKKSSKPNKPKKGINKKNLGPCSTPGCKRSAELSNKCLRCEQVICPLHTKKVVKRHEQQTLCPKCVHLQEKALRHFQQIVWCCGCLLVASIIAALIGVAYTRNTNSGI